MGKDSAARIELGRSFHQMGSVKEKVHIYIYIYIYIYTIYTTTDKCSKHSSLYLLLHNFQFCVKSCIKIRSNNIYILCSLLINET